MTAVSELLPVEVPDIGDFAEVPVIEILVAAGDTVAVDDPLLTLESDKATMDVPAPFAGSVRELHVQVGDRVSQGTLLLTMAPAAGSPASPSAAAAASAGAPSEADAPDAISAAVDAEAADGEPLPFPAPAAPVPASPIARRVAREHGIDITRVSGSGRGGRITREDVERFGAVGPAPPAAAGPGLDSELPPWPSLDFSRFGEVERVPRSRIQRISAPNLARNWVMIPHVTHHDEADVTELESWRRQLNADVASSGGPLAPPGAPPSEAPPKVTMLAFLVVACVRALREFPDLNASLDGEELIRKRYYNIGFAADTPEGLVVPVVRGAERMGLREVAGALNELSVRARAGRLRSEDIAGGTFSISSLGGIGGTAFTPLVNAPEVAILGATRAVTKPVWDGDHFAPRLMLPLSLSYDHRAIDGAAAARFVVYLAEVLGDLRRILL